MISTIDQQLILQVLRWMEIFTRWLFSIATALQIDAKKKQKKKEENRKENIIKIVFTYAECGRMAVKNVLNC